MDRRDPHIPRIRSAALDRVERWFRRGEVEQMVSSPEDVEEEAQSGRGPERGPATQTTTFLAVQLPNPLPLLAAPRDRRPIRGGPRLYRARSQGLAVL